MYSTLGVENVYVDGACTEHCTCIPSFSGARQLPNVSLSPQRKSFHGGCSWNDSKAPDTPSSAKDNSSHFEFESAFTPLVNANQGSTQQGPPPVSRHKVIDHVPLRDQELGRGNKKNWRERTTKEPAGVSGPPSHVVIGVLQRRLEADNQCCRLSDILHSCTNS